MLSDPQIIWTKVVLCSRVPIIAQPWTPGLEEVETQGGNGRKWESKRGREKEC